MRGLQTSVPSVRGAGRVTHGARGTLASVLLKFERPHLERLRARPHAIGISPLVLVRAAILQHRCATAGRVWPANRAY